VTDAYVVMHHVSGRGKDSQWFDFKPTLMGPTIRVEWDLDTRHIIVPQHIATVLIKNGYARSMTSQERDDYLASEKKSTTEEIKQ
jgi:hypothetical protein